MGCTPLPSLQDLNRKHRHAILNPLLRYSLQARHLYRRIRRPRPKQALWLMTTLILLTEIVTPSFKPPPPFRLSLLETRIASHSESADAAFDFILLDYLRWHAAVTNSPDAWRSVRILAWNGRGDSGLGDKIRGVLHAFSLAIETRRYFIIEENNEFPIQRLVRPASAHWDSAIPLGDAPVFDWRTSFSRGKQGVRRLTMPQFESRHQSHPVVRLASSTYPLYERTVSTTHWRIACRRMRPSTLRDRRCGYLSPSNIRINRALLAALFQPRRALRAKAAKITASIPRFVAVHARLGGVFRKEAKTARFASLNANWSQTADVLLSCARPNGRPVYLATDDERFKRVFADRARTTGVRIVLSPIRPRHSGTVPARELVGALSNSFVEAIVLGASDRLVTTGSGLATFATFLGKTEIVLLDECEYDGASR